MTKIALDIGHGTNTKGKRYAGFIEHDFNSDVGIRVKHKLEQAGFDVYFPQFPNSEEVGLSTRTKHANYKEKPDLYYSIHGNASTDENADGCCCFHWHSSKGGKRLANIHAKNLKKYGFKTHGNGIHESEKGSWTNLHVVRETHAVALLTENGFYTNTIERELMKTDEYRERLSNLITDDIKEYFGIETDYKVLYEQTLAEKNILKDKLNSIKMIVEG